jgi:hypothetical protein
MAGDRVQLVKLEDGDERQGATVVLDETLGSEVDMATEQRTTL